MMTTYERVLRNENYKKVVEMATKKFHDEVGRSLTRRELLGEIYYMTINRDKFWAAPKSYEEFKTQQKEINTAMLILRNYHYEHTGYNYKNLDCGYYPVSDGINEDRSDLEILRRIILERFETFLVENRVKPSEVKTLWRLFLELQEDEGLYVDMNWTLSKDELKTLRAKCIYNMLKSI